MKPSAGRIVMYVNPNDKDMIRPAVIVAVSQDCFPGGGPYAREECQLHVFWDGRNDDPDGKTAPSPWATLVPHDEEKSPGSWFWPPRV
jgi:hypothetical protein